MTNTENPQPEVTMANTKREMLEAYNQLQAELEAQREQSMKPAEKIAEKKKNASVTLADSLSLEGIAKEIGNLKADIGGVLINLSNNLEGEIEKYLQVKEAVVVKEQELNEIYEIEKTVSSLTALLEVQQQKRQRFEDEISAQRAELKEEIAEERSEWQDELKKFETDLKEKMTRENKKRERESEEYKYQFEREQKLTRENFEYEKTKLEREGAMHREELELNLKKRESEVKAREEELNNLREKVANFPALMEESVKKTTEDITTRIATNAENKQALLQREYEGEKNVLQSRIDALERAIAEQSAQITKLSQQLDKSRNQAQDIALKAIEGSSNLNVITPQPPLTAEQPIRNTKGEK